MSEEKEGASGSALAETRREVHHAVQILAAFADAHLERRDDDGHSNLGWDHERLAFATHPDAAGVSLGFHLPSGSLLGLRAGVEEWRLALAGQTLEAATAAAAAWLAEAGTATGARPLALRGYEMPDHPVARGAAFRLANRPGLDALTRWFDEGDALLRGVAARNPGADLRTWPHHFDHAFLLQGDDGRSNGIGLSPGDEEEGQPYLYVNAWPAPEGPLELPALAAGRWVREGWFGARLDHGEVDGDGPEVRTQQMRAFVDEVLPICRRLAGRKENEA
jgi:hypothetical protein